MIKTVISQDIILKHLEDFKHNLPDEILHKIKIIHDKFVSFSLQKNNWIEPD